MSYGTFLAELKQGLPELNYLLVASDPFIHTEALHAVREIVPAEEIDFSFHVFDMASPGTEPVTFDRVIDVLNTIPFFGGKKYVIVSNAQKLLKQDLERLGRYLEKPSESSVLILLYAGTLKKKGRDTLAALKYIPLDLREQDIPAWMKAKARDRGFELSDAAVRFLLGTIGPDLGMLSSEIEKCMLIGKKAVSGEDIRGIVERKRSYTPFDLVKALRAGHADRVFRIYKVLSETEEPYGLMGVLNWQFGQLLAENNSPVDRENLKKVFADLHRADSEIKTSGGFYPMELLLRNLLRSRTAGDGSR